MLGYSPIFRRKNQMERSDLLEYIKDLEEYISMLTEGDHDKMRGFAPERMTDERLTEIGQHWLDFAWPTTEQCEELLQALKAERESHIDVTEACLARERELQNLRKEVERLRGEIKDADDLASVRLSMLETAESRLTRLVKGLSDLSDDLKECCELEIRGAAGDLLKNTRRELQALIKEVRDE